MFVPQIIIILFLNKYQSIKFNIMRKLKVNSKLAVRKVKRQDNITKGGLLFVASVILPSALCVLYTVLFTNPTITFGGF